MKFVVAALVFIFLISGVTSWFLFPPRQIPRSSDVVVVMAGSSDGRHQLGAQFVEAGLSRHFVVSNPLGFRDEVGTVYCRGNQKPEEPVEVWCMRPEPVTTIGEVEAVSELSVMEGWTTITVVTSRIHSRRVLTMFEQCTNLDVVVIPVDCFSWTQTTHQVVHEIGGYIKFWITHPC